MASYLALEDIKNLQVDHTTSCNLLCPQCVRVAGGRRNPNVPHADLTPKDYASILEQLKSPLESILFCGNYGDVAASHTFVDSLVEIKKLTNAKITLMTNGSLRSPDWWADLAQVLHPSRDKICWSIDGLEHTNAIYRINSNFEKIMENANAFITAGGRARWDFIAFRHNEHQIEAAKQRATQMGFYMFSLKRTSRFITDLEFRKSKAAQETHSFSNAKGHSQIAVPEDYSLRSFGQQNYDDILKTYSSWENYVRETPLTCKFKESHKLFIDFEMQVWPCTWLASPVYAFDETNSQKVQLQELLSNFPPHFNSLRHNRLDDVLKGPWFQSLLVESFQKNHPGRLVTCGRTCGDRYDYSASSKDNRDFLPLLKETTHVI